MARRRTFLVAVMIFGFTLTGCNSKSSQDSNDGSAQPPPPMTMQALFTASPVHVDGKLDDAVWKKATVYPMRLPLNQEVKDSLQGNGEVQLAWDKKFFYVAVRFTDDDIVAEGKEDQLHHYKMGDLCELFLKSDDHTWYWELYATPLGRKTAFWFPGRGRVGLPSGFEDYRCGLRVAAQFSGTLNDWRDKDTGWTAEMAMPIADLTAHGETFGLDDGHWRILVARYNYSRYLPCQGAELSSVPRLSTANYHLLEEYAILKLVR
jgi:hypothetical protein